jgi:hypothetical protein
MKFYDSQIEKFTKSVEKDYFAPRWHYNVTDVNELYFVIKQPIG